jgi:negative regulator of flagellin synthesis FlgM
MQIYGPAQLHGPQGISAPHANTRSGFAAPAARAADTRDTLEISAEGMFAEKLQELPEMRLERIATIREQIQNGTYETDDKLDLALSRLLDEIG